ncbi:uncharacterized protein LOC141854335 [Brevipalpus obovatus]|uniref:uncharacterized protein LOC141854335 n=1 Tax=Brevipalpus obovatus TaxID=246614 RepID=UPI003D9FA891
MDPFSKEFYVAFACITLLVIVLGLIAVCVFKLQRSYELRKFRPETPFFNPNRSYDCVYHEERSPRIAERIIPPELVIHAGSGHMASNASSEVPYINPSSSNHVPNENHVPEVSPDGIDGISQQVSYNKISVREPLSKILAERALIEHHYNEVDEERNSCVYEEIAGSTNSSVTYTKISDLKMNELPHSSNSDGPSHVHIPPSPSPSSIRPIPPSVKSLKVVAESSRSASPQFQGQSSEQLDHSSPSHHHTNHEPSSSIVDQGVSDLYAHVDKSAKTKKFQNLDELYAKVQKGNSHKGVNRGIVYNSLRMSSPENVLSDLRNPPSHIRPESPKLCPPPPPLLKNMPCRSNRTTSMYDEPSKPVPFTKPTSHHRRHSFSSINHIFTKEEDAIEDPGYEIVGPCNHHSQVDDNESEADPNYEAIRRVDTIDYSNNASMNHRSPHRYGGEDEDAVADPGYEVVNFNDDICEPCYEVINKSYKSESDDQTDPGYECVKSPSSDDPGNPHILRRNGSDNSVDAGYERVRFVHDDSVDSDPAYASINEPEVESNIIIEHL